MNTGRIMCLGTAYVRRPKISCTKNADEVVQYGSSDIKGGRFVKWEEVERSTGAIARKIKPATPPPFFFFLSGFRSSDIRF